MLKDFPQQDKPTHVLGSYSIKGVMFDVPEGEPREGGEGGWVGGRGKPEACTGSSCTVLHS